MWNKIKIRILPLKKLQLREIFCQSRDSCLIKERETKSKKRKKKKLYCTLNVINIVILVTKVIEPKS